MTSARIARGAAAPKARATPRAPAKGKGGRKNAPPPSALPELIRRASAWIFAAVLIAVAIASLIVLQVPQMIGMTVGESLGEAGFKMKHVEIKGAKHVPQLEVYNVAFDQPSSAMPLVDLEGTRQRLLQFGWVREARVSRRLPDTLVVDIVERRPAAIWQHNQRLSLIDMDGVVLEQVKLEAMPDLPIVIGAAANLHAGELGRLVQSVPQLKPMMEGASWVGGRRWDLRFSSGEVLALPEGEEASKKALAHFAKMDQATQLLGRGFVRFDMRVPGKFIVRVSSEPGSSVPSIAPEVEPAAPASPAAKPAEPARKATGTPGIDARTTI
jgi:cell division protein FtsQ